MAGTAAVRTVQVVGDGLSHRLRLPQLLVGRLDSRHLLLQPLPHVVVWTGSRFVRRPAALLLLQPLEHPLLVEHLLVGGRHVGVMYRARLSTHVGGR